MAKRKTEQEPAAVEQPAVNTEVFELSELWEMKFRDPNSGSIVMVRRAFKPRGKLEFYQPEA